MTKRVLTGVVSGQDGRFTVVSSPDAPGHLQILHLDARSAKGAKVGDRVRMEYFSTASYGLWYVTEILPA